MRGVLQDTAGEPGINHVPVLDVVIAEDAARHHDATEDRAKQDQSILGRPESLLYVDTQGFSNGLNTKCLVLSQSRIDADSFENAVRTAAISSGQGFVFAGWREMQIHVIEKEIDGYGVVHQNRDFAS